MLRYPAWCRWLNQDAHRCCLGTLKDLFWVQLEQARTPASLAHSYQIMLTFDGLEVQLHPMLHS